MRLIFYIFLVSQLVNFLGVFAEKGKKIRLNKYDYLGKLEKNKSKPLKRLSGNL